MLWYITIYVGYRKIGLNDASHKKGMELRLLHGVAKGEPWFGRWGYRFGSGTYGVTQKIYEKALESVRNVPLCLLNHHLTSLNRETPILLSRYQTLSTEPLITLSDLFMFMLHLHSRLPRDNYMNNSRNQIISIDSLPLLSLALITRSAQTPIKQLKEPTLRNKKQNIQILTQNPKSQFKEITRW